jgi:hypothetical protein
LSLALLPCARRHDDEDPVLVVRHSLGDAIDGVTNIARRA